MEFYSESNRPKTIPQPTTNPIEDIYEERINKKTGEKEYVKVDEYNIYDKIQESLEETKLENLIRRYQIDPKLSAIKIDERILDYTNTPNTLLEALTQAEEAKEIFNQQATEIKRKFNNNYTEFLAAAANGELEKILKEYLPKKEINQTNIATQIIENTQNVTQGEENNG